MAPQAQDQTPSFLSSDGSTPIRGQAKLRDQWVEHFDGLLNRTPTVDPKVLNKNYPRDQSWKT